DRCCYWNLRTINLLIRGRCEVEGLESFIISKEVRRSQENGLTLLHLVVIQGNVEKVKFLLSQEANMDIQLVCGYTPLIVAVQKRSPEICSVLIEHSVDVNMADKDSCSPLHFAAQNGDDRIVRLLLDHQAQADSQEREGWTPLHLADPNSDLERKQKNHQTPLHFAVEKGKFRVVQYLLNSGASVSCLDENHYSALHMAAVKGKYLIGEKLIKYRANVDLRTDKGWTPLTPGLF
uniref:Uncharacterized protein n=1 Tax=Chelonoidis abingdonii TaxID=106734 RepID=A0A8C0HDA3_CHEAB